MRDKIVSIILRSYNEEKWIGACLRAIFDQNYKEFEVILVDNNSTDQTVKKAQKYPVKVVSIDEFLPGKAINMGIRESKGDFIVCLSAHCIPVNDAWLSNLLKNFDDTHVAGVYGRQEPMAFTPDNDKRDLLTIFGLDRKIQTKDSFFHNANSMIKRDIWEKIPFDEKITNIEDRLWAEKVIRAGYQIVYDPEASVYHYHGIHQNQNPERLKNVVKILEDLGEDIGYQTNHVNMDNLNIIALIPVRGKILYLDERPLLEYTIKSAKESRYIRQVIVSTDSQDYAKIAEECGAVVPFMRERTLSEDHVDLESVYQYSINKIAEKGIIPDVVVPMEITFPFRPKGFLDKLISRLVKDGLDSVVAVRPEFGSCWVKDGNGEIKRVDNGFIPRKFKEAVYLGIKGLGCATYPVFLREGHLLGRNVGILELTDPYSSIEVRDERGLDFARELSRKWHREMENNQE